MKKYWNHNRASTVVLSIVIALSTMLAWLFYKVYEDVKKDPSSSISNYEECLKAGNPTLDTYPEKCTTNGKEYVRDTENDYDEAELASPSGSYTLMAPAGWGKFIREKERDIVVIIGDKQPTMRPNQKLAVVNTNVCCGGPEVLRIEIVDKATGSGNINMSKNKIDESAFKLYPNKNSKNYTLNVHKESFEAVKDTYYDSFLELKGDKTYVYTIDTGKGKLIEVIYNVYGIDPRNQLGLIEDMVKSIKINPNLLK